MLKSSRLLPDLIVPLTFVLSTKGRLYSPCSINCSCSWDPNHPFLSFPSLCSQKQVRDAGGFAGVNPPMLKLEQGVHGWRMPVHDVLPRLCSCYSAGEIRLRVRDEDIADLDLKRAFHIGDFLLPGSFSVTATPLVSIYSKFHYVKTKGKLIVDESDEEVDDRDLLQHAYEIGNCSQSKPVNGGDPLNVYSDEKLVWPWIGIVVNIPTGRGEDGQSVGESLSKLRDELIRVCLVEFKKNWPGLHNAMAFEKAYEADHHGKKDWNRDLKTISG
ncbi:hypothetical protein KPL71_014485 [Citrus sinensis]|uniref:Uncharacterized protein n=1 Tax=Citrus sinensis TaxID=2711 RepID=A0ACB8KBV5_CITSI|nr:hypothetical protein KPL71_014485 [Citrus sinensis]